MWRYFTLLACLSFALLGDGAEPRFERNVGEEVKALARAAMAEQKIPGLAIGVVKDGEVVFAEGFGHASVELDASVGVETLFGLGSVCKQFTAGAIMLLVEDGKVKLEERLPEIFEWSPPEWSEIRVRHLLTHTSGIKDEEWPRGVLEFDRKEHDQLTVVKTAFGPLLTKPDEKFAYNNVGYRLLGMIIEKRSGRSYWAFLDERILRPLRMEETRNSDPGTIIPKRARGYGLESGRLINREPVTASSAFSQGALISSVTDLAKWDAGLEPGKLFRKSSLDLMWRTTRLNDGTESKYGFGWFVRPVSGHYTVAYGGGLPGFTSFNWKFLDDKLTVIVLSNQERANLGGLALNIAGLYAPALLQPRIKSEL